MTVTTLGFGAGNYKDVMMEQLANKGNGNYFYIDSQAQAKRVFLKDIMGTLQVIAKDVKIQVQFNEWVKSYRLVGYENRALRNEDFTNDKVDAGEIGSGHQVTALYEVTLSEKALADATNLPGFGTVKIRAKAPEGSESVEYETVMNKTIHSVENAPKDLQFAVAVVGFAEILRKSPHAENWKMDRVAAVLKSSAIENERDYLEFGEVFKAGGKLRP